jgi:hypothetical protein
VIRAQKITTIRRRENWPKWARYLTVDRAADFLWSALPEYGGISCRWNADLQKVKRLDICGQPSKILRNLVSPTIRRIVPSALKRKIVYLPPGIYPVTITEMMFPSRKFRIIITDDEKKWTVSPP